ncbi:DUF6033 family protein [Desulfoscipio gibsoniae]|uniref:Uncharacterized protein n=1 Tax=Desulfoscipio gibsoniae DSM 7213 TaxID=767817 RepID=R4KJD5_9FIRM|nr:DUF6033 family protein [Desulfoscipio gibsoniae]AGL01732.1 hypothetical protein Desgi_2311 [Desulfoscipio gibsoniae DSM 7213]
MLSSITRPISYALQQNDISSKNRTDTSNVSFKDTLSQAALGEISASATSATVLSSGATDTNSYLLQLQSKFGTKISVQNMEYSKANINHIGSSTSGTGNVIIASNILEKMASDPQTRQHYERKIQAHFDTIGEANAFMAMHGRRIVSSGVIIHPNGEVTYYSSSDYTPEEKARLEKAMKEEDEAKAKKRAEEKRLNEIAQIKYLQFTSNAVPKIEILSSDISGNYFFKSLQALI